MWGAIDINKFQLSMTVTSIATLDNQEITSENIQLLAFIGDECRGSAQRRYEPGNQHYLAFMMVWGNAVDANKKITFKSINSADNKELTSTNVSLGFIPEYITGSAANPYQINFVDKTTAFQNLDKMGLKVYPNPVSDVLHFDYDPAGNQKLELIDNVGRSMNNFTHLDQNSLNV